MNSTKLTQYLLTSAALAVVSMPSFAFAQDASEDDSGYEEIIVTAQKRSENLQDVPLAITAFSTATLENKAVDDVSDLSFSVPNLAVNDSGASLRGIGNLAISSTSEGGLGYHVNGVYIGAPASVQEYFDIGRIEVLRGPQGTLYGRNTTAGVLNIITQKPTFDLGAYVTANYGNYDSKRIEGAINLPVSDAAALRVAGYYLDRDGYTQNLFTGNDVDDRHSFGLRGSFRLDMGDTTADLVVGYFKEDSRRNFGTKGVCAKDAAIGCSPLDLGFSTPDSRVTVFRTLGSLSGTLNPAVDYFAGALNPTSLRQINQDIDPTYYDQEWNASLEISHEFGSLTLTSVSGYQERRYNVTNDFDRFAATTGLLRPVTFDLLANGTPVTTSLIQSGRRDQGDYRQWTQEVRLASDFDGAFNFLLGGNYYDQKIAYYVDITHAALAATQQAFALNPIYEAYRIQTDPATTKSFGLFGEAYFDLGESTRLTGGIRYSNDKKTVKTRQLFLDPLFSGGLNPNGTPFINGRFKKGVVTGRLVLDHDFASNIHGYVSVSRGYKAGGINPGGATVPTFKPESLSAGEVGLKFNTFDGALLLNSSAFYYDYKDLQIGQVGVTSANTVNTDAKVYGAEFEWTVRPPESGFQMDGAFSLLSTELSNFQSGDEGDPNAIAPGSVIVRDAAGAPVRNGSGVIIKNLDGNKLPFSPGWKISIGAQYRFELGELSLTPRIDHYEQSKFFGTAFNKPIDRFSGYRQTDLKLLLEPQSEKWSVRGYVKNLFNNDDVLRLSQEGPLVGRFRSLIILEPRTYGIEATVRF
jgi:outer membrane receptor protein involved in Fe transport